MEQTLQSRLTRGRRLAGIVSLLGILAACGGSSQTSGTSEPSDTPNANAVNGGTVTIGSWQEPGSLLDANILNAESVQVAMNAPVQEGLLWYKPYEETTNAKTLGDYWRPWLATAVPTVDNGLVKTSGCKVAGAAMCVTWPLRTGVTWHDGNTFSSHDVCDTFKLFWLQYKNQKNNPTNLISTSGWDQVIDCDESDPNTAVVSFSSTYGPYLGLGTGVSGIQPSYVLDKVFKANADLARFPVDYDLTKGSGNPAAFKGRGVGDFVMDGTGPFALQIYQQTKQLVLVRNNHYWNQAHQPHLDKIVVKVESDVDSQLSDIKTGAIDMSWDNRLANLKAINDATATSNGRIKVQTVLESGAEKLDMNLCAADAPGVCDTKGDKPARFNKYTADPIIRHAILEGINRNDIIAAVAAGQTTIPKDSSLYLGAQYVDDPSVPTTAFDRDKANRDLDAAGYRLSPACGGGKFRAWKDGSCIVINVGTTSQNSSRVTVEGYVADDLAAIGIEVPKPYADNRQAGFLGSYGEGGSIGTHQFDMALYTATLGAPAEPDTFYSAYHGTCGGTCTSSSKNQIPNASNPNGQNDTALDDPVVDKALDDARSFVDLTRRAQAYRTLEEQLAKDLPEIPLYRQVLVNTYTSAIQEYHANDMVWTFNSYDWYCTAGKCQS